MLFTFVCCLLWLFGFGVCEFATSDFSFYVCGLLLAEVLVYYRYCFYFVCVLFLLIDVICDLSILMWCVLELPISVFNWCGSWVVLLLFGFSWLLCGFSRFWCAIALGVICFMLVWFDFGYFIVWLVSCLYLCYVYFVVGLIDCWF